jgi:hypothetical protein
LQLNPVDDVEQERESKVLGVILNYKLHFESQCTKRMYLVKLLRKQGLPPKQLNIVYQTIITSRIQNAISAWGGFIKTDSKSKIDTFLLCSYRADFCRDNVFNFLLFAADQTLFRSMSSSDHSLHSILPAIKTRHYELRDRGHELALPEFRTVLHEQSFLMRHLFNNV